MRVAAQRVQGELWQWEERAVLLLQDAKPDKAATDLLFLRYAFVVRGVETHFFPAFLLDDWGAEVRGMRLYAWVREFGEQFPRAELFGFSPQGEETQYFLRDIELYAKLPCYVYRERGAAVEAGVLLDGVAVPSAEVAVAGEGKRPLSGERPLRSARLRWWQVPPDAVDFDWALFA